MNTNIGITEPNRRDVAAILNAVLADAHVLYIKTRNFHWNVTGAQFIELHKFFEEQYNALAEAIDEVAERVRMLGERPAATMGEFLKLARLKEESNHVNTRDMISRLLDDHETVVQQLRRDIDTCDEKLKDTGTADFLTGLMRDHEKHAWMLRAHLEG